MLAPALAAALDFAMASAVLFVPVPAMTGRRRRVVLTTHSITPSCSSPVNVGDSPVVPHGTARVRCQISAAHTKQDLDFAVRVFRKVGAKLGIV